MCEPMKIYHTIGVLVLMLAAFYSGNVQALQQSEIIRLNDEHRMYATTDRVSAAEFTFEFSEITLPKALRAIADETGLRLNYSTALVPSSKTVNLELEEVALTEALDYLLADLGLGYVISSTGHLVISERQDIIEEQTGRVFGQVQDAETGEELIGATVRIEETRQGIAVGADGEFELTGIEEGSYTLYINFVGYESRRIDFELAEGEELNLGVLELRYSDIDMDELIVTATGLMRSREVGSSQSRVDASDFETAAVGSAQEALAGRVAGVQVLQNAGQPGTGGTIRLRGNNSITQGNNPIIYIDGIRIHGGSSPVNPASGQATSPFNHINPNDIQSMDVVKGAAATTLYGTEASGGVIRITTRQGEEGVNRIRGNIASGFNNMPHVGPREGNPTGLFANQCRGDDLVTYDGSRFEDPTCPEDGSWFRNGMIQRYNLSLSGGIDRFSYYVSGSFADEESVVQGAGGHNNVGLRSNFRFYPVDDISVILNTSYNNSSTDWIPAGNNADSFYLNVTRGNGGLFTGAEGCEDDDITCVGNGEILNMINTTDNEQFVTSLALEHNYANIVNNRFTIGYDYNAAENQETYPFGYSRLPEGEQNIGMWNQTVFSLEYVGTWDTDITSDIQSTFNWGGQLFRDRSINTTMISEEFSGPQEPTLESGARKDVTSDTRQTVVTGGFFLQEMLNLNDRLFLTAGLRVDGNSAFGEDFGMQAYPQFNTSFVISDYDFWPEWWHTMRLRAAIGESGKAPGTFDAVRTYRPISGDDGQPGFTPGQLGNPDLGPERSREFEAGFTSSMLNGYINVDATYYYQNTYDALIPVPSPASQGFLASQLTNIGQIMNTGVEVDLNFDVLRTDQVNLNFNVGYSNARSEAVDLGGVENIVVQFFGRTYIREGYPVPAIFADKLTNPDEMADPELEEDTYIGPAYPETNFSFGTDLQVGDYIRLNALGELYLGGYMINGTGYQNARRGVWPTCYEAQNTDISNLTAYERGRCALTGGEVTPQYDYWVESTDFFRMRNISVNFTFPDAWTPDSFYTLSLNLSARNLFTITEFEGMDPEVDDYRGSLARRDYYNDPTYRSFIGTLNFAF